MFPPGLRARKVPPRVELPDIVERHARADSPVKAQHVAIRAELDGVVHVRARRDERGDVGAADACGRAKRQGQQENDKAEERSGFHGCMRRPGQRLPSDAVGRATVQGCIVAKR
jgi:hypothetical protein